MEREMQMDLARQMEQLNKEMDEQLLVDLQVQSVSFLRSFRCLENRFLTLSFKFSDLVEKFFKLEKEPRTSPKK